MTLEAAIKTAQERDEQRRAAGLDQDALDEAARQGFANGAFEDLAEDVPAVVEEFFPPEQSAAGQEVASPVITGLRGRLEGQMQRQVQA
jgi:hypothetical protein